MKKLTMLLSLLCLTAALAVPASALEYDIAAPGDPEYGKPTSVEPVATADRGELSNVDVSKNAALVPPAFGSPTAYTLNTSVLRFTAKSLQDTPRYAKHSPKRQIAETPENLGFATICRVT